MALALLNVQELKALAAVASEDVPVVAFADAAEASDAAVPVAEDVASVVALVLQ
jgi:hypothetical protein